MKPNPDAPEFLIQYGFSYRGEKIETWGTLLNLSHLNAQAQIDKLNELNNKNKDETRSYRLIKKSIEVIA